LVREVEPADADVDGPSEKFLAVVRRAANSAIELGYGCVGEASTILACNHALILLIEFGK
jgi:hypothetical protein